MKGLAVATCVSLALIVPLGAQTPAPALRFEVASVNQPSDSPSFIVRILRPGLLDSRSLCKAAAFPASVSNFGEKR